jgi:hypothetical protein
MITDQGCTKAVILLPCKEESGSEDVAKLFLEQALPFIGLSQRIICHAFFSLTVRYDKD